MVIKPEVKYFLTWDEAFQSGVQLAGGKGWNLGRLATYGFNIPMGGVLTTLAYDEFIRHNSLQDTVKHIAKSITIQNIEEADIQNELLQLRKKIKEGSLPQLIVEELIYLLSQGIVERPLAVRSSASAEDSSKASFAGIHESFLNVRGFDNILAAVKGCYASLWSPQAVVYRRKVNISDDEMAVAVVVMEMVEAQSAGVGFTCDPQTGRQDVLVVNANFGLGESVVNGAVEPDTYYLEAGPWSAVPRLISRKTGRKEGLTLNKEGGGTQFVQSGEFSIRQVLPDEKIKKLGLLLLRVFEALGDCEQHQDVEWVFDGRDFVLVQARPVTALPRNTFAAIKNQPDIWSNGNYRDAVPMVLSPLNRSLMKNFIVTVHESSFTEIGYQLPEGLQFSRFFNGRLYANMSALQWAWFDSMGGLPRDINIFWGGHQPEIEIKDPKPYKGLIGLKRLWHGIRSVSITKKATKNAAKSFAQVLSFVEAVNEKELRQLPDGDIINLYDELCLIVREFGRQFSFLSGAGTMPLLALFRILVKYFSERTFMVLNALMVGGASGITSADHGYRLVELAEIARRDKDAVQFFAGTAFDSAQSISDMTFDATQLFAGTAFDSLSWEEQLPEGSPFKQSFRDFIGEYGHRAVYELDIINPRWKEDPSYLMGIIQSTINTADLGKLRAEQKEKFERAWLEIKDKVPSRKHSSIRKCISKAQAGAAVREMTKSVLVMAIGSYRMIAQELGSRFCERGIIEEKVDIYFCTWPELVSLLIGEWNGVGLRALIEARKATRSEMESISAPDIIFGETPKFIEAVTQTSGNCLKGVAVATGKASGIARLISHPDEGSRLQPGDVLVAPSTDPGWTPLFLKACAVVMETGGFLSHGAIVAREYGVPAVVNIPGVMKVIKDGRKVVVDGDEGKVYL